MFRMNDSHDRGHWETIVTKQSRVEDGIRLQEIAERDLWSNHFKGNEMASSFHMVTVTVFPCVALAVR